MPRENVLTRLRSVTLPGAVVGLFFAASVGMAQEDSAELLERGERAYEEGRYEEARESLWAYLDATATVTGASRLPQAEALYLIALMEPDAAVAARHYDTIVEEYPASSVSDQALFRLAQYAMVDGRGEEARERFARLGREYPFSRHEPEVHLWVGRSYLAEDRIEPALTELLTGFQRVRAGDTTADLPERQLAALEAEYAWWLASAYRDRGDLESASQYYALLASDHPESPQADEARDALAAIDGRPVGGDVAVAASDGGDPPDWAIPDPEDDPAAGPAVQGPPPGPSTSEEADRRERENAPPVREAEPTARAEPEPERTPVEPRPVASERSVSRSGTSWLQVGAFSTARGAAEVSKRLKDDGFDAEVQIAVVDGQGFYRVRVGPFRLPDQAERLANNRARLDDLGYPSRQVVGTE